MSTCPTAVNALEHDTGRRLEAMESSSDGRPLHDVPRHDVPRRDTLHHAPLGRTPLDFSRFDVARTFRDRAAFATAAHAATGDGEPSAGESVGDGATGGEHSGPVLHTIDGASDRAVDPAREALERTCLTVKRIAHDIGMPRATLEAYRLGTRRMPQVARVRLGTYLAAHAAMLDGLAQALMAPAHVADA